MVFTMSAVPANASVPDAPPADKIVIDVVSLNGTGCTATDDPPVVSPDNTAFTVVYSKFIAQVGPAAKPSDFRKMCQLMLWVHVPQGFTYAIAKADYRGYASLAKGASATQRSTYYFQGDSSTYKVTRPFSGPLDESFQTTDEVDIAAYVYAPCGATRYLAIKTELTVNKGTSSTDSMMFMDSTDGGIDTLYHFHWKKCPKP